MDPRVEEHARIIAEHSTDIERGDNVMVQAPPVAQDLVVALYEVIGEQGARPLYLGHSSRAVRAYKRAADPADFELPEHLMTALEATDIVVGVRGAMNTHETGDVPPEKNAAFATVHQPLQQEMLAKRWVGTQYPAPGNAQDAEMSTEAYEDFVWGAINKDWDAQRAHQAQLVDRLDPADEVRLVSGDTTDLRLRIDGNPAKNDFGKENLPGGEVFTSPRPDSAEGEVLFDRPLMAQGREVVDVHLVFEGGKVTDFGAAKHEEVLAAVLDTDPGAKRLGELGIGMNRDIDRFTCNMLFDEKMGDTVHLALGMAFEETVGDGNERNESAVHQDMIVDMSEDSRLEVDGEVIQRDGTFVFEDGFEG